MKKNFLTKLTSLSLTTIVAASALVGCGGSSSDTTGSADSTATETTEAASSESQELETITVTPHAEILEAAKEALKAQGYDLQVTVFDDYVQPNEVVESGQFDANYFQHIPYLESYNEEHGTHLVDAGDIHYEPFGIYPGTKSSLDDIEDGDVIAIPNDTTNEARALLLLQDNGLLTLKDGVGLVSERRTISAGRTFGQGQSLSCRFPTGVVTARPAAIRLFVFYRVEGNIAVFREKIETLEKDLIELVWIFNDIIIQLDYDSSPGHAEKRVVSLELDVLLVGDDPGFWMIGICHDQIQRSILGSIVHNQYFMGQCARKFAVQLWQSFFKITPSVPGQKNNADIWSFHSNSNIVLG